MEIIDSSLPQKHRLDQDLSGDQSVKLDANKQRVMSDVLRREEGKSQASNNSSSFPYEVFDSELANCKEYLNQHGVVVLPRVISSEQLEAARNQMYDLLEHMLQEAETPFDRNNPETWSSFQDLLPWHGMALQHFEIGHSQVVWDIRQHPALAEAFSKLWGCEPEDMITSFDGVSFQLPPEQANVGFFNNNLWFHADQSYTRPEFNCIQGMVNLWDVEEGDATLVVWPESHNYFEQFGETFGLADPTQEANLVDYQQFGADPVKTAWLHQQGLAPKCVKARAGSLILWDSRTIHQGIQCVEGRKNPKPRCVIYVCQKPRSLADPDELRKRREAFECGTLTTHWPYPVMTFPRLPQLPNISELPIKHLKLPFQTPGKLEQFWKPEALEIWEAHQDTNGLVDGTKLKELLIGLRQIGFQPEEAMEKELSGKAPMRFETLWETAVNTARPQLTNLGKRLAGYD